MGQVAYLQQLIAAKDIIKIKEYIKDHGLCIKNGKIYPINSTEMKKTMESYDRLQHIKKIQSNSGYGAMVNKASRFNDKRIGQSITLTGRIICKHMNSLVNECITGEYNHEGEAIIGIDTDSSQFSAYSVLKPRIETGELAWNRDTAVSLYTSIGKVVNESFPAFMNKAFHTPEEYGKLIKGSCESVGTRGLFITKKRYAILNYFYKGLRIDGKEKLKAMGLDLRRSDTPVICQEFLKTILLELLNGGTEDTIVAMINDFKKVFKALPLHEQGTPRRVNSLTRYAALITQGKGNRAPGHVRAAINWNHLRNINKDNISTKILDGMKICVIPLKDNTMNMTSIGVPIDEIHLPDWFTNLPFDGEATVQSLINKKVENLLGKLPNWDSINSRITKLNTFEDFFS